MRSKLALMAMIWGVVGYYPTSPLIQQHSVFANSSREANFTVRPKIVHEFEINYHVFDSFEISVSSNATVHILVQNCDVEENMMVMSGESSEVMWPLESRCLMRHRFLFKCRSEHLANVQITFRTTTFVDLHRDDIVPNYFNDRINEWSFKMVLVRFFGNFP